MVLFSPTCEENTYSEPTCSILDSCHEVCFVRDAPQVNLLQGGAANEHVDVRVYEALHHMLPSTKVHKHNSTGGRFAPLKGALRLAWPLLGIA